ncbi:glycosyltransferase WbuB [Vibrio ponticus]|uniref:Glycosyltransferase WbuB n=1 Tax=Vibrio ponticus TaxID=265668 RepID=A0A3N3DXU3_9VIBR|nr:glycosyltransferase family 4 protein [Vibrio ponticus]ROV59357.1 glycosyltransferase WbuB [Vibrio ponticus]
MNILLINHYAGSPEMGMEYRPFYMAKSLAEIGHSMFILGADHSHLRKIVPKQGYQTIEDVEYLWLKSKEYDGNGVGRVINIFSFLFEALRKASEIIAWSKPDVIVASSTYPLDNYLAHFLARKCGARVVYEVHDLWPLSPMEIGNISKWHPFMMLLQASENFAYKKSAQVISMLPNTLEHMLDHGLSREKFHYIPNGVYRPDSMIERELPFEHQELLRDLKAKGRLIVGYAGGHAKSNALDNLIKAAQLCPEVDFVLVGEGSEKVLLQSQSQEVENIHFLPAIHKDAVPSFLACCDILTIVWLDSPLYRFGVSANKLFDYMLARKPVVQLLNSKHEPITLANAGYTASSFDEYIECLKTTINMTEAERNLLGERAHRYVHEHHCYSKLAAKFIEVCEK